MQSENRDLPFLTEVDPAENPVSDTEEPEIRTIVLKQSSPAGTYDIELSVPENRTARDHPNTSHLCRNGYQNFDCRLDVKRGSESIYFGQSSWPFRWLSDSVLLLEQAMGECGWSERQVTELDLATENPKPRKLWSVETSSPCEAYREEGQKLDPRTIVTICHREDCYSFVTDPENKTIDLYLAPEYGRQGKRIQGLEYGSKIEPEFHSEYAIVIVNAKRFRVTQDGLVEFRAENP